MSASAPDPEEIDIGREIGKAMNEFLDSPETAITRIERTYRLIQRMNARTSEVSCIRALRTLTSMNKDWRRATEYAKLMVKKDGKSAANFVMLATFQERDGETKAAARSYSKALKLATEEGDLEAKKRAAEGLARLAASQASR